MVENKEDAKDFIINVNAQNIKYDLTIVKHQVMTLYHLLLHIKQSFKDKNLPLHLIFFLNIQNKNSKKTILTFEDFNSLLINEPKVNLEVTLRDDFKLLDDDSSIISILDTISDHFELIMDGLSYWDLNSNFNKKENLYFTVNQLASLYNTTYNYIMQDKVNFLQTEYQFASFAFSIINSLLNTIETRVINLMNVMSKNHSSGTIDDLSSCVKAMKDLHSSNTRRDFLYNLVNTMDLIDS